MAEPVEVLGTVGDTFKLSDGSEYVGAGERCWLCGSDNVWREKRGDFRACADCRFGYRISDVRECARPAKAIARWQAASRVTPIQHP